MRREHYHFTTEQVKTHLADALTIVYELELTDELRPIAFRKAVELLAGKSIVEEQVQPGILGMAVPRGMV